MNVLYAFQNWCSGIFKFKTIYKVLTTINKIVDAMEAVNENIKANINHTARRLQQEPDN